MQLKKLLGNPHISRLNCIPSCYQCYKVFTSWQSVNSWSHLTDTLKEINIALGMPAGLPPGLGISSKGAL
jgi:hypothetical protein